MERQIIDSYVYDNLSKSAVSVEVLSDNNYSGYVSSALQRYKLRASSNGIPVESVIKSFRRSYEMTGPVSGDCSVLIYNRDESASQRVSVTPTQLRILKALCYEQLSESRLYSQAVSGMYFELVRKSLRGEPFEVDIKEGM